MSESKSTTERSDPAGFAATRWTLVLDAAGGSPTPQASAALAELCRMYWYPLYAYVRRHGRESHEAEDLTQEFFLRLVSPNFLADVDRRHGRFRAFLLASFQHFLANAADRNKALKRGGGRPILSLDVGVAETRYQREPFHTLTPEKLFERHWALTILEQVLVRLQAESYVLNGGSAFFDRLKPYLTTGRQSSGYAEAADDLAMTEGAVKVAVHRLRRRYRQLLREEIAQTLASAEEIDDEIRHLWSCLQ
ncbi:MAG: sigma-70 family RNA polymerase sigma factor [Planctomycetaceae bacterium]|nr:sigma-70 family RNA polymerase sigma factor [Planctomycetaceae bacterium]